MPSVRFELFTLAHTNKQTLQTHSTEPTSTIPPFWRSTHARGHLEVRGSPPTAHETCCDRLHGHRCNIARRVLGGLETDSETMAQLNISHRTLHRTCHTETACDKLRTYPPAHQLFTALGNQPVRGSHCGGQLWCLRAHMLANMSEHGFSMQHTATKGPGTRTQNKCHFAQMLCSTVEEETFVIGKTTVNWRNKKTKRKRHNETHATRIPNDSAVQIYTASFLTEPPSLLHKNLYELTLRLLQCVLKRLAQSPP